MRATFIISAAWVLSADDVVEYWQQYVFHSLLRPAAVNLTWSMEFVIDALATGRRIKCLICVNDFTKECLTVTAAFDISGIQVTRILDSIALFRGYLATIRIDQRPEFTCRALDQWAFEHGVELRLIQPDKPHRTGLSNALMVDLEISV